MGVELSLSHLQAPGLTERMVAAFDDLYRWLLVYSPLSSLSAAASDIATICRRPSGTLRQFVLPVATVAVTACGFASAITCVYDYLDEIRLLGRIRML